MSTELEECEAELQGLFKTIDSGLEKLSHIKDAEERHEKSERIADRIQRAKEVFMSFKVEVRYLPRADQKPWKLKAQDFNERINKLASDLKWTTQQGDRGELMGDGASRPHVTDMSTGELVQAGVETQEKSLDALGRTKKLVQHSKEVGAETAVKLKGQTEQLQQIHDQADELHSELDVAKKELYAFMRRMSTDRIIMVLVCLVICGLVGAIIYAIAADTGLGDSDTYDR